MNHEAPHVVESGLFVIRKGETEIGRETYRILAHDRGYVAEGHSDMTTSGGSITQEVRLATDSNYNPLELQVHSTTAGETKKVTVVFGENKAQTISEDRMGTSRKEFPFDRKGLVLASNVFHHFTFFLRHYDSVRGGIQEFSLFPTRKATIERTDKRQIRFHDNLVWLEEFLVDVGGILGVKLLALDGCLVRLAVPIQGIEAVLQGTPEIASLADFPGATTPPAHPIPFEEHEVKFPSQPHVTLAGTLTLPASTAGPCPAAVLVSGSGAQDRNEDSVGPGGLHYGIFRTIAERLSASGIAVLRYDDRGVGKSTGTFETATVSDLATDVRAALQFLRSQSVIDAGRLGIVGHSEGGTIASIVAADDPRIRAIVLMASAARPLDEVLLAQFERIAAALPEPTRSERVERRRNTLKIIKETHNWDSPDVEDEFRKRIPEGRRNWFHEHFALNPPTILQRVPAAVAILQGLSDYHVNPSDTSLLGEALRCIGHPNYVVRVFPELDHLFMRSRGRGLSEYADRTRKLDEEFLSFLTNWLVTTLKA